MAGLFGGNSPPPPPPMPQLPEPIVMPENDKDTLRRAQERTLADRRARQTTRRSTILSDEDDALGGAP